MSLLVVRNHIAKLNDNNCKNISEYIGQGLSATEAFNLELKKNRHKPSKIKGCYYMKNKWNWIVSLLEMEMKENQLIQTC